MSSVFADLVAAASPEITAVFARPFQLLPRVKGADINAPVSVDASRAQITFMAVLALPHAKPVLTNAYDARTDQRPGTSSDHPILRILPDVMRATGLVIKRDDLVLDVEQNVRWRIVSPRTTANVVRECTLNLVSQ